MNTKKTRRNMWKSGPSLVQAVRAINMVSIRFSGGGGGRPGQRPAFNWKEKKLLGFGQTTVLKPWKDRPFGDDVEVCIRPYLRAEYCVK
jgi:hypothetical protein